MSIWISCMDKDEPTDRQLELLETILRYDGDLRPEFERKACPRASASSVTNTRTRYSH